MKLNLDPVVAGYRSVEKINENSADIMDAVENTLSRDGTAPNYMLDVLDMNDERIINVGAPVEATDAVRKMDLDNAVFEGGGGSVDITQSVTNGDVLHAPSGDAVYDFVLTQVATKPGLVSTVTNGDTTHAPSGDAVYDAISAAVVSGGNIVQNITSGDTTHTPSGDVVYTALAGKLDATAVTSSVTNGDTTHVPTSDAVYDAIAASGGTVLSFKSLKDYGSVEDGVTDDKAAFDAAVADTTTNRVYIEGHASTTNAITDLTKHFYGPGRVTLSAFSNKRLPARFTNITALPTQGTGSDINYYFSSDNTKVDAEYVRLGVPGGTNFRQNLTKSIGGAFPYFEAATTPHFWTFQNYVGWSGLNARTTTLITSGVSTSADLNNATHGLVTGQTLGFVKADGTIGDTKVITVAGANISWTGTLSNTYAIGSAVTLGYRTMNPGHYASLVHNGGGDAYVHVARATGSYVALASQTHIYECATTGLYGGDIALTQDGNYATGIEISIDDNGKDCQAIGDVRSFVRTNDTGDRAAVWLGTFFQSTGSKPINAFHTVAGIADVGLDLVALVATNSAAIQMASDHRVIFNSTSSSAVTNKGGSPYYSTLYGNVQGNSYIHHKESGGLDARGKRLEVVINGSTTTAGYGSFNVRGAVIEAHKHFTVYKTDGTLGLDIDPTNGILWYNTAGTNGECVIARFTDQLAVQGKSAVVMQTPGGIIGTFSGTGLGASGSPGLQMGNADIMLKDGYVLHLSQTTAGRTGFLYNGGTIYLYKDGAVVASW